MTSAVAPLISTTSTCSPAGITSSWSYERAVQTSPPILTVPTPSRLAIRSSTSAGWPTSAAAPVRSVGTVKIGGEVWTARAYDENEVILAGEQVEVVEIRGATALVMP